MPVSADNDGRAVGTITIPANVPVGSKRVTFQGSGGSFAEAVYTAEGFLQFNVWQRVVATITRHYDPLAQTFVMLEARIIKAIDIKVTAIGNANNDIRVQIRETSLGVPTQDILTEGRINVEDVTLVEPNTVGAWTRITFEKPVALVEGREYALVLMTDDGYHAVAIATLGQYAKRTENDKEGWITRQPYQIGVLLSSSNASSWTIHQSSDLCFRLVGCDFTATNASVDYGDIAFANTSDFFIGAEVERPDAATDAVFKVTELTGGDVHNVQEFSTVELTAKKTTNVSVECDLSGTAKLSPIVYPQPQVQLGEIGTSADYVSRGIQAAVDFDATVIFEVLKPGVANCVPTIEKQVMDGQNPEINGEGEYVSEFVALTKSKSVFTGNGWIEETWGVADLRGVGLDYITRVKLALSGTAKDRPYVRNLRVIIK